MIPFYFVLTIFYCLYEAWGYKSFSKISLIDALVVPNPQFLGENQNEDETVFPGPRARVGRPFRRRS